MGQIRYVILSDLHLGAQNSLLTSVIERPGTSDPGLKYRTDPSQPSPLLTAILAGLRRLIGDQGDPPTLILAGDALDLALSPDGVANAAFGCFVDLAFGVDRLFAPLIYYLPGNHDHHLWEAAREAQYMQYLRDLEPDGTVEEPWHTTRLLMEDQRPACANLMSTLIHRRPRCDDIDVRVAYPNLALVNDDQTRVRVVSHGHYTESIYTLMSQLRRLLFPDPSGTEPPMSIDQMEAENFAWIDFFWGTLGRSGAVGSDIGLIYADLTSPADLDVLAANLARGLVGRRQGSKWLHRAELALTTALTRRQANHLAASERGSPDITLSGKGRAGVRAYLEGPVLQQLSEELGRVGTDVGFVFGHTHKPFVEDWRLTGFPAPVKMVNTGGWVVDTAQPALTQGGVAVLIDDELTTASLQFYQQSRTGGTNPVRLLDPPGPHPPAALHAGLAAHLDRQGAEWRAVAEAADELIGQRHRLQADLEAAKL